MAKKKKQRHIKLDKADKAAIRDAVWQELEIAMTKQTDLLCDVALVGTAVTLMDVCGLKDEELAEALDKWLVQFDCIAGETVLLDELKQMVKDEAGVTLNIHGTSKGKHILVRGN